MQTAGVPDVVGAGVPDPDVEDDPHPTSRPATAAVATARAGHGRIIRSRGRDRRTGEGGVIDVGLGNSLHSFDIAAVRFRDLRTQAAARRSALRACRGRGCEACLMPLAGTGQGQDHSDGGMLHEAA